MNLIETKKNNSDFVMVRLVLVMFPGLENMAQFYYVVVEGRTHLHLLLRMVR